MANSIQRTVLGALMCAAALAGASGQGGTGDKRMNETSKPTNMRDVTMKGELGVRYTAATCNLLTRPDRYPLSSYVASAKGEPGALWWDWPGDQLGRMFSVMQVAQAYGWTPAGELRKSVADAILPCQTKDGYFGKDTGDRRLISGNAFALRGLLDAYEDTRDARFLEAARRLGRYAASVVDRWAPAGDKPADEFFHYVDGLVKLYELGGDDWALAAAKTIASRAGRTAHAHHSLTFYRGMIELYRVTGDRKALAKVEDYLAWCKESRLITGGLSEGMPKSGQDEGCATSDYVVVNLMMFGVTGDDLYLAEAEHILVNHFMMSQFHTGGFGHRVFNQQVLGGKEWQGWDGAFGSENPGCCSLWGQWALGQVGSYLVTGHGRSHEVNLYADADVTLAGGARLEIRGDFPRCSQAQITLRCDKAAKFPLSLRVPAWATSMKATVGGESVGEKRGSRLVVDRRWKSGDRLEIRFGSGLWIVPWDRAGKGMVGVFDGPLCLGLRESDADPTQFKSLVVDAKGKPILSAGRRPQAANAEGKTVELRPVYLNWMDPDAKNPKRLRVTFESPVGR